MPGVYVYAVVPDPATAVPEAGIGGGAVTAVDHGPVAALVSVIDGVRVRPSRANVAAHERVVDAAHRRGPVLPVRFGTVMPDEQAVQTRLLEANLGRFSESLRLLEGKVEFRLRARYHESVVLREIVTRNPAVRTARAASTRSAGRDAMIGLGELVRAELIRTGEADATAIMERLAGCVARCRELPARSDTVALHAALLVDRDRTGPLEEAVDAVGSAQAERMVIELTGPLAPWDFMDLSAGSV